MLLRKPEPSAPLRDSEVFPRHQIDPARGGPVEFHEHRTIERREDGRRVGLRDLPRLPVGCVYDRRSTSSRPCSVWFAHTTLDSTSSVPLEAMNITKSSRHSKIAGDFGEALVLYWLSKHGFECARVDHTGLDLIARNPNTEEVMGISVKSRT
jgi:hypothetical protein